MGKKEYYFKLMPYVYFEQPLTFHIKDRQINIVSYNKELKKIITKEISSELDKWIGANVDYFDKPLQDISIIYFENNPCYEHKFSEEENKLMDWIIHSICYVFAGMAFGFYGSANNFKSNYIKITIPSTDDYFSINVGRRLIGGLKYGKNKIHPGYFVKPQNIILQKREKDVLDALGAIVFKSGDESGEYMRILRAIGWFNQTNCEETYEQPENQIIYMSIAFESLINTPREKVTEYFKGIVCQLVSPSKELIRWADQFYDLRSKIVHGDEISKKELLYGKGEIKHVSHYYLSKLIFTDILLTKMKIFRLIEENPFFKYIRISKIDEYLLSNKERLDWIINHTKDVKKDVDKSDYESKTFKLLGTINVDEENLSVDASLCDRALKKAEEIKKEFNISDDEMGFKVMINDVIEKISEIKEEIKYRI
jgi:hypothetical protein